MSRITAHLPRLILILAIVVGGVLIVVPPAGLGPAAAKAAPLALFAIALWATATIPEFVTALIFFLLAMLFAVAPASVVFSGFASTAFWLVFAGLVIGVAVQRTGLGARIADRLTGRFGTSYAGLVCAMIVVGTALGFVMPAAMGRLLLLTPVAVALADRLGLTTDRPGRAGLILATAFGCFMPPFAILSGNVANLVLAGAAETLYGITPTFGAYLLLHFPVLGLLKALSIAGLVLWLFPDHIEPRESNGSPKPWSAAEWRLALVLTAALALWLLDFLHGVSPAWIGLAAALALLLPRIGVLAPTRMAEVNLSSLIYVAGILGFGATVAQTGLGEVLAAQLLKVLPLDPATPGQSFTALVGAGIVLGLATTVPGVPAVLAPLAGDLAEASGLALESVLMLVVLSFSTIILPYQAPPLVVAMQLGRLRFADIAKLTMALAAVTIVVLLPLDYLWWRLLGWIG